MRLIGDGGRTQWARVRMYVCMYVVMMDVGGIFFCFFCLVVFCVCIWERGVMMAPSRRVNE